MFTLFLDIFLARRKKNIDKQNKNILHSVGILKKTHLFRLSTSSVKESGVELCILLLVVDL